jgi:hypothetical protein
MPDEKYLKTWISGVLPVEVNEPRVILHGNSCRVAGFGDLAYGRM